MKKNTLTKIVIAFVMLTLIFALVACGGNGDNNETGGGTNTNKCDHVDANGDEKCDNCGKAMPKQEVDNGPQFSVTEALTNIIRNAGDIITTLQGIKSDSTVGLEAAVGAYYSMGTDKKSQGEFAINLAANVANSDPELSLGVSVNKVDYFTLGYKDAALYLLEGLNLINSNEKNSNKIKIGAKGLEEGVNSAMAVVMQYLEYLANIDFIKNLNMESLESSIAGLKGILDSLSDYFEVKITDNSTSLLITPSSVNQILATETADGEPGLLAGLIGESYLNVLNTIDNVLNSLGIKIGEGENAEVLTLTLILNKYLPAINVDVNYSNNKIDSIDLGVIIENLNNFSAGIKIELPVFSTSKKANISFSGYTAQDLKVSASVALPEMASRTCRDKGVVADVNVIVHTSDALDVIDGSKTMATVIINATAGDTSGVSYATFNGQTLYLNFEGLFEALRMASAEQANGVVTEYTYSIPDGKNLVGMLNDALKSIKYVEPKASGDKKDDKKDDKKEESTGTSIWATIYNIVAEGMFKAEHKADATQEDCVQFLYTLLGEGKYVTIIEASDKTFSDVLGHIMEKFEMGKETLKESAYAKDHRAGVQLINIGQDGKIEGGLIAFVANFINIPVITENEDGTYTIDTNNTAKLESVNEIVDYIKAAFKAYNGNHPEIINAGLVSRGAGAESILELLEGGIYLGVGTEANAGLEGYIEIANKAEGDGFKQYVVLGAGIEFITTEESATLENVITVPETMEGIADITTECSEINSAKYGEKYLVTDALWGLLSCLVLSW